VIAVDLLGHGGSEKPTSGYSISNQADLVAQALGRLGVRDATVVGHSLGGGVAVGLAEQSPQLVNRIVIIDTAPGTDAGDHGLLAKLSLKPVIGPAFWRIAPDSAVRKGLEVAFAPGFDVPDAFVEDVDRMTYSAYKESHEALDDYREEEPLDQRVKATGKPLLVIMGAEEQIIDDPEEALQRYGETVPEALTNLIQGVGHSPNVEEPTLTATLIITFDASGRTAAEGAAQGKLQHRVQNREGVRRPS
jgi:pimeloyl-ACP methyl ester carboxylesterase